jgi:hypothetical protein
VGFPNILSGEGKVSGKLQGLLGTKVRHEKSPERLEVVYSRFESLKIPSILVNTRKTAVFLLTLTAPNLRIRNNIRQ